MSNKYLPFVNDYSTYHTADKPTKRQIFFYAILSFVLFILAAFPIWDNLMDLCQMIGSFACGSPVEALKLFLRRFPAHMISISLIFMGFRIFNIYRAEKGQRARLWKNFGITTISIGGSIVLSVIVLLIVGVYGKMIEGTPTLLFPLDTLLGGLVMIGYGVGSFALSRVMKASPSPLPSSKPKGLTIKRVAYFFSYMMACFSFAGFCHGVADMDWKNGGIFFNVMLLINFAVPIYQAILYRYYYMETRNEKKQYFVHRVIPYVLVINCVLFFLYLVALQTDPWAPATNASAVLPIEGTASINAFAVLFGIASLVNPCVAFLQTHIFKKFVPEKEADENQAEVAE